MKNNILISLTMIVVFILVCQVPMSRAEEFWPPKLGAQYPDLTLVDQSGKEFNIADLKGSVIVIEYIGMNCPACQAYSGANTSIGPFENNAVQRNLPSIEESFLRYSGGISLSDERIIFMQILLYDMNLGATEPEEAKRWAEHFQFEQSQNEYVTVPIKDLRGSASYNLIPGFQLIDKNFILRSDSTGHYPKHNLYTQLLPMVPKLLDD